MADANKSSDPDQETGLTKWKAVRKEWQAPKGESIKQKVGEVHAKNVDVEKVIECIFATKGNGELDEPVPLGQMIDILLDFWEADGLYD